MFERDEQLRNKLQSLDENSEINNRSLLDQVLAIHEARKRRRRIAATSAVTLLVVAAVVLFRELEPSVPRSEELLPSPASLAEPLVVRSFVDNMQPAVFVRHEESTRLEYAQEETTATLTHRLYVANEVQLLVEQSSLEVELPDLDLILSGHYGGE